LASLLTPANTEITASAVEVNLASEDDMAMLKATRQRYAQTAWDWYKKLPEVHYPANFVGYALSMCNYYIAEKPDPRVEKYTPVKRPSEAAYIDLLEGVTGDVNEMARRYGVNRSITAEAFLVGEDGPMDTINWELLSNRELLMQDDKASRVYGIGVNPKMYEPGKAFIRRFWKPHSEFVYLADGPLEPLDTACEELHLLTESVKARVKSRLASNGILFVPQSLQLPMAFGGAKGTTNTGAGGPNDPFINSLIRLWTTAIINPGVAAGALPTILRGPDEAGERIKHIVMDPSIVEVEISLRAELVQRIARGMDLPPEIVLGMADTNHWSSWSIMDSAFKNHIAPIAREWVKGLTRVWLRPLLVALGVPVERAMKLHVAYDASALLSSSDEASEGRELLDRGVISEKHVREVGGIPDSAVPDEQERVRLIGMKIGDPYLATFGMDIAKKIDWDKVATAKPEPGPVAVGGDAYNKVGPGNTKGAGSPRAIETGGKKGTTGPPKAAADGMVIALAAWLDSHIDLCRSRAGARARASLANQNDKAAFSSIKGIPNDQVLLTLGVGVVDDGLVLDGIADEAIEFASRIGLGPLDAECFAMFADIAVHDSLYRQRDKAADWAPLLSGLRSALIAPEPQGETDA